MGNQGLACKFRARGAETAGVIQLSAQRRNTRWMTHSGKLRGLTSRNEFATMTTISVAQACSFLFVPATHPERFQKARASGAGTPARTTSVPNPSIRTPRSTSRRT